MNNVKTAISILWCLITIVIGSYYFVLTNDVQNLEKELAQINRDIRDDIRDIHLFRDLFDPFQINAVPNDP